MVRAFAMAIGSLLFLAGSPAWAVPGFAYYSRTYSASVASCTAKVQQVVQSVVGAPPGNPTKNFGPLASVTSGFIPDTGVLVQCIAHTEIDPACDFQSSDLFIFAFSDAGAGKAAVIRDQILAGFGNFQTLEGCGGPAGVGRNPVNGG